MMTWIDIACIVFSCVTVNHLGLIKAVEEVTEHELPILNCPKCLTFWATVVYCCDGIATNCTRSVADSVVMVLAISFLASYMAIWLELMEGYIDTLYIKMYGKIITTDSNDAVASDADGGDSDGTVPELQ